MAFSRFEKLAPEKREHLLDVAAREFAIHGFAELYRLPLLRAFERPWLFTVISVAAQVSPPSWSVSH